MKRSSLTSTSNFKFKFSGVTTICSITRGDFELAKILAMHMMTHLDKRSVIAKLKQLKSTICYRSKSCVKIVVIVITPVFLLHFDEHCVTFWEEGTSLRLLVVVQ